ncbi:MAG: fibronectin type III domain-containing protein [Acidobacteriaceae bacterium]
MDLLLERKIKARIRRIPARWLSWVTAMGTLALLASALGCGLEAAPQPPSLHLPKTIPDLTASRAGNQVHLEWKTPRETTDKLRLHGPVRLRICRQADRGVCETIVTISSEAGKPASYTDVLPPALVAGAIRPIGYEIFGVNQHGRSAGPSNAAAVLAGQAPPMVRSLSAAEIERGVVLHWLPVAGLTSGTFIQLERALLTPPKELRAKTSGGLRPVSELAEQTLRVDLQTGKRDPGAALDASVLFNRKYQYIAMRVTVLQIGKQTLRLESAPSAPVEIDTRDVYPPAAPTGLAAVPISAALNGGSPEVDLSWSANPEPDVARYYVYRRAIGGEAISNSVAQRIAPVRPSEPVVAPAFRDLHVEPGQRYAYSVVAVDNAGNKSRPSAEVQVIVPGA